MSTPWKIDQGYSSLCGIACLYYIFIQRDANAYKKVAVELHRTGIYKFSNGYIIEPNDSMYEIKPSSTEFQSMKMAEADWITLASTRSSESNLRYNGIESGSLDQLGAVNWMGMLTRMCKELAGYKNAKGRDLDWLDVSWTVISQKEFSIEKLIELDKKFHNNKKIILMISPKIINNQSGWRNPLSIHWVVYNGNLKLINSKNMNISPTSKPIDITQVTFDIYTWGKIQSLSRIKTEVFSKYYYGYIEAH